MPLPVTLSDPFVTCNVCGAVLNTNDGSNYWLCGCHRIRVLKNRGYVRVEDLVEKTFKENIFKK
jgi:hypothetical protein